MYMNKLDRSFPGSSVGKEATYNAGDPGLIPGSSRATGEEIGYPLQYSWASLVAQLQCGRPGFDPWVGKIPWRKERLPTPVSLPGEFHGLAEKSDTIEQPSLSLSSEHKEEDIDVTEVSLHRIAAPGLAFSLLLRQMTGNIKCEPSYELSFCFCLKDHFV